MANNYCEFSAMLEIPEDKVAAAMTVAMRVCEELESDEDEGYVGCNVQYDKNGIWFSSDAGEGNADHVERIAKAVLEEMEIDEPFYCSWAFTCSKPRIDEFGGGAMKVQRGKETMYIDAMSFVQGEVLSNTMRELLDALAELAIQADDDCPQECRSKHFKAALAEANRLCDALDG